MSTYKKGYILAVFVAWFVWGEMLEHWGLPVAAGPLFPFLAWAHCSYIVVRHYMTIKETP